MIVWRSGAGGLGAYVRATGASPSDASACEASAASTMQTAAARQRTALRRSWVDRVRFQNVSSRLKRIEYCVLLPSNA